MLQKLIFATLSVNLLIVSFAIHSMAQPLRPETHPLGIEWLRLEKIISRYSKMNDGEFDIQVRNATSTDQAQFVEDKAKNPDQLPARLLYIFRLQKEQENIETLLYTQTNFNLPAVSVFRYLMRCIET